MSPGLELRQKIGREQDSAAWRFKKKTERQIEMQIDQSGQRASARFGFLQD